MIGSGEGGRVRVLVAPHNFELGGSQLNALELVEKMSTDPRFEFVLYAPDGILVERARKLGIEIHLTRLRDQGASVRRMRELSRIVRDRRIDLMHAYEWMPTVDAAFAVAWRRGVPVLSTVLSMDYPYLLPASVPLVLGTRSLVARALGEGREAYLLEPPVDTELFRSDALADDVVLEARRECGAGPDDDLVVVVGRLVQLLKLEGLLTLIEAVGRLARTRPVRLAVVGDGPERATVEAAVRRANAEAGTAAVRLLGARYDPLPYYLAADIAVGMGGSALRAMAVERPLLVQGEAGFWDVVDAESIPVFLEQGWYGVGDGRDATDRCAHELAHLLDLSVAQRAELARAGRRLVVEEYSLDVAARRLADLYLGTLAAPPRLRERVFGPLRLGLELVKSSLSVRIPALRRWSRRLRGRPVAPSAPRTEDAARAVSVVIPCHNYVDYLDQAIRSALEQDGVCVDVTIIDDGSTDGSVDIARRWAERDDRVRLVAHERNRGHIATFNEALDAATAPYVMKLDADDVLTPGSLRRAVDVLEACPTVAFVYGQVQHVRGPLPQVPDVATPSWRLVSGESWIRTVARHRGRNPISQPEIVIRRSLLERAGGHRAEVPGTSDLHLWLRLASLGDVAWIRNAVQGLYRVHGASMRATIHSGLLHDVRARRDAFELFLAERGGPLADDPAFARSVRHGLARDALTNAFLDVEAGHDPQPLLDEAVSLDPSVRRTIAWWMMSRQRGRGASAALTTRLGRFARQMSARWRWHRQRLFGQ